MRNFLCSVTVAAAMLAVPAHANFSYKYSTDGITFTYFEPLKTDEKHVQFYGYTVNPGSPTFKEANVPFARADGGTYAYLHKHKDTGKIILGVILDSGAPTQAGSATLTFDGLPSNTENSILDDPGEGGIHFTSPGGNENMAVHQFEWGGQNQSDGIGLRNIDEQGEFEITLVMTDIVGLTTFSLLSGPSADSPVYIDLGGVTTTLYIRRVPAPAGLPLLAGMALVGGYAMRKYRKS